MKEVQEKNERRQKQKKRVQQGWPRKKFLRKKIVPQLRKNF